VVDESVDHGGDGDRVAEGLGPGAEWLVGADDQGGPFVAGGDQGVEQGSGFGFEGDVADLIADQQRDAAQPVEFGVEAAGALGGVEPLDPLVGGGEGDPVAAAGGLDGQRDGQVGFAGAGRESDRLQQLRAVLPSEVRVTSTMHPLSGRLVVARSFKRLHGELLLVIELPDGSPGTIAANATDVLGSAEAGGPPVVLDAGGWRRLRELVVALAGRDGAGR
jgi:hypothetical protein